MGEKLSQNLKYTDPAFLFFKAIHNVEATEFIGGEKNKQNFSLLESSTENRWDLLDAKAFNQFLIGAECLSYLGSVLLSLLSEEMQSSQLLCCNLIRTE